MQIYQSILAAMSAVPIPAATLALPLLTPSMAAPINAPLLDTARLTELCKALSDEHRLKMLLYLASGAVGCCGDGVCACDLETLTGLSQPTVSHHMKLLVAAGLVNAEKRGRWVYYQFNPAALAPLKACLALLQCC
jgi:ArsR family transcriptional regulator, arsenate/arsenite/antimonite-responsive transcriptional repressor